MTKSTCLHIQDRESGPIRVVEIPWISVRIGRAAYCEVRLSEHDLADCACRLKRRGSSWQLVPVANPNPVWFDGRPLDEACPLPYDVPFHVGGYCLTLRQDQTAEPDWGMYGPPSPRQLEETGPAVDLAEATKLHTLEAATTAALALPDARTSEPGPPRAPEHPDSSTAPNPSPADILKHRWETRWKAAEVEIKSRAERYNRADEPAQPTYGAGFESVPLKEARIPSSEPVVPPRAEGAGGTDRAGVGQAFRPDVRLESLIYHGRRSSAVPLSPLDRPVPTPDVPPIEVPRDLPAYETAEPGGAPPSFWDHWAPTDEIIDSLRQASPPPDDAGRLAEPPGAFDFPGPQSPLLPEISQEELRADEPFVETATAETVAAPLEAAAAECERVRVADSQIAPPAAEGGTGAVQGLASLPIGFIPNSLPANSPPLAKKGGKRSASSPAQQSEPQTTRSVPSVKPDFSRAQGGTSPAESHQTPDGLLYAAPLFGKRGPVPRGADSASEGLGTDSDHLQWPSAKEILAAHQAAQRARAQPAARKQTRSYELPTVAREPGRWVLPAWLAGPPIALFVLVCGTASCILSWAWAGDSYSASIMTDRLLSAKTGGPKRPLPDGVVPPDGTWVRTTAQHLAHWAVYNSRSGDADTDTTSSDVRALFERAMQVSPINPTARLALAQLDRQEGASVVTIAKLGLSRDVLSLTSTARRLLAAGRKDAALEMYRKALEIASHRELSRYGAPRFSDDPTAPRYLLPGEDAVREIVRALISQNEWTFAEWSRILPKDTTIPLVAARLLREEERHEAEELIDLFLRDDGHRAPKRAADPVLAAARAEAHALLSHWKEAEQEYHQAIELVDDDTIRRSWWFNLADIAFRLEDEGQRRTALQAARAVQTSDEISRRAIDSQRSAGQRARLRSTGTKAN